MRDLDADPARSWEKHEQRTFGPTETLTHLKRGKPFAMLFTDHRVLITLADKDGKPLLRRSAQLVLITIIARSNWGEDKQGGIPGTWVTEETVARESGLSVTTASAALDSLGTGTYRVRDRQVGVLERPGLNILREANPDEREKMREHLPVRVGRPPKAWILCHPSDWRLPPEFRKQFDERRALLCMARGPQEAPAAAKRGQELRW